MAMDEFDYVEEACVQSDGSIRCLAANFNLDVPITFESDVTCLSMSERLNANNMTDCYATVGVERTPIEVKYLVDGEFLPVEYENDTLMLDGSYEAAIAIGTVDLSKCEATEMEELGYYYVTCAYNGTKMTADLSAGAEDTLIIMTLYDRSLDWKTIAYIIIGAIILSLVYTIYKGRDKR